MKQCWMCLASSLGRTSQVSVWASDVLVSLLHVRMVTIRVSSHKMAPEVGPKLADLQLRYEAPLHSGN